MTMIFDGLVFWERALVILELSLVISGLVYLILRMISGKALSFNMTKGQLSYASENKGSGTLQGAVNGVFFQTLETVAMMTQIKTKLILHDQMTYLEERLIIIRDNILDVYRQSWKELAKNKDGTPLEALGGSEYTFYKSLVDLMKEDMKSSIRVFFLRNHFSSYDDKQLAAYIAEKNELLMVKAYQFLRDMYPSEKMSVSFYEIESGLNKIRPDLENCLEGTFRRAIDITKERHQQIKDLEADLRFKIKTSYGVDIGETEVDVFSSSLGKNERSR